MRVLVLTLGLAFVTPIAEAAYLYRVMMVRAAPGELAQLIDLFKETMPVLPPDERPFWMRHSQGDQWDRLLVYPVKSFTEFYSAERIERRARAVTDAGMSQDDIDRRFHALFAWHEDVFVEGPPLNEVRRALTAPGFSMSRYSERFLESWRSFFGRGIWRTSISRSWADCRTSPCCIGKERLGMSSLSASIEISSTTRIVRICPQKTKRRRPRLPASRPRIESALIYAA